MRGIRINYPGDGVAVMKQNDTAFRPGSDHSICTHRDGVLLGGFVVRDYVGNTVTVHTAGFDRHWLSRDLLWMVSDYVFNQLNVANMLGFVELGSKVWRLSMGIGMRQVGAVQHAYDIDRHMAIMCMSGNNCRWLNLKPRHYARGNTAWV